MKNCPICKKEIKQLNPKHIKNCFGDDPNYKIKYINHNFPITSNIDFIKNLYEVDNYSIPMLCKEVGGLDLKSMVYVLNYYGIRIRTIKETRGLKEYKERIESTNIEKYGQKNPLSKGTEPWKKKNKTVLDKYGVENVWQCIDDFISSYGSRSKFSKLNNKVEEVLKYSKLIYESEFRIKYEFENKLKWKFYDFKIGNYLLEVNGDYWHANPNKYKENDTFKFPKNELKAKDIWEMDTYKKEIAESNGYKVIYIWETELNKMNDEEILQFIKNQIN